MKAKPGDEFESTTKDLRLKYLRDGWVECTHSTDPICRKGERSKTTDDFDDRYWKIYKGKSEQFQDLWSRLK